MVQTGGVDVVADGEGSLQHAPVGDKGVDLIFVEQLPVEMPQMFAGFPCHPGADLKLPPRFRLVRGTHGEAQFIAVDLIFAIHQLHPQIPEAGAEFVGDPGAAFDFRSAFDSFHRERPFEGVDESGFDSQSCRFPFEGNSVIHGAAIGVELFIGSDFADLCLSRFADAPCAPVQHLFFAVAENDAVIEQICMRSRYAGNVDGVDSLFQLNRELFFKACFHETVTERCLQSDLLCPGSVDPDCGFPIGKGGFQGHSRSAVCR